MRRSCENCGNVRCANSLIAVFWDECVKSGFTKHWMPKDEVTPLQLNCDECVYISITEADQHNTDLGTPHICTKYKKRVFHNSSRPGHHERIYPCKECIEEAGKT